MVQTLTWFGETKKSHLHMMNMMQSKTCFLIQQAERERERERDREREREREVTPLKKLVLAIVRSIHAGMDM